MKKRLFSIAILLLVFALVGNANAARTFSGYFNKSSDDGYIYTKTNQSSTMYDIGSSSVRIPNIYATNLDTNTITINTASEGKLTIDVTDPEALLIRRNSDAGDLAVFDTTNFDVGFFGGAEFSPTNVTSTAVLIDQNANHKSIDIDSEATSITGFDMDTQNTSGDLIQISVNSSEMLALDYLGNLDVAQDVDVGDDLLLATAGVIDWNSTDKLTHSANTMTVSGFTTWDMGAVATLDFDSNIAITTGTGDVDISGASLGVDATEKLLLDGISGHTYLTESSADELDFYAGGTLGLRIDANENEVQPLMTLAIGPIELEEDSGAVTLVNLPVSSTPSDGDEESFSFSIDSNSIFKIKGSADGTGGADTFWTETYADASFDSGNTITTIAVGDTSSLSCLKLADTDGGGYTYCTVLNGTMTCSTDPCN